MLEVQTVNVFAVNEEMVAVGGLQSAMVIAALANVPGKSGSVAVMATEPGPLVAINTAVKVPEAFVIVAEGMSVPSEGCLLKN